MTRPLRIVVADDELDMRDYFRKVLPRLGHVVVGVAESGQELIDLCLSLHPDLILTDIKMPGIDGIEAAIQIYEAIHIPVILISAFSDSKLIERAEADHIMCYLVKPIKQTDLEPAIALSLRRFEQFEKMRREVSELRKELEKRES